MEHKILLLKEHNHYYYGTCHQAYLRESYVWENELKIPKQFFFRKNQQAVCFQVSTKYGDENQLENVKLETSYYIGLQYIPEWGIPVLVQPKVNKEEKKLNFLGMLTEALKEPENFNHLDGLMEVDFDADWIEIPKQHQVELTPFLIVQFLMAVKQIVRKGLKKSYYPKTENLRNRIKGKILVGKQIKQNIFKQRLTNTVCTYQEFGFDTPENRFIKYVLQIVYSYIGDYDTHFKTQLSELLSYNLAAFHQVEEQTFRSFEKKENNPFYKVYNTAFDLGNQILRLMSHSYGKTSSDIKKYPPHWIDMSKLFELFVFKKLRERFPNQGEVKYHEKMHYQELDFIIRSGDFKAVVDAKYKPRYESGNPTKEDARQLSGYSRLEKVYQELKVENDEVIPVYFVYPKGLEVIASDYKETEEIEKLEIDEDTEIQIIKGEDNLPMKVKAYRKMYMQEISLDEFAK